MVIGGEVEHHNLPSPRNQATILSSNILATI